MKAKNSPARGERLEKSSVKMMIASLVQKTAGQLKDGLKGILPLLILALYTIIGAILFQELEGPNELYTMQLEQAERDEIMERTAIRLNNVKRMPADVAFNYTVKTLLRYQEQLKVKPIDYDKIHWSFFGSVFYCITVYTTIGYGNIVPVTTEGRVLTLLYAFAGIPIAVICIVFLGTLFARFCRFLWKSMIKSTSIVSKDLEKKVSDAVGIEDEPKPKSEAGDDEDLLNFPISFLIFVTILWILFCALIFKLIEGWDYGTSMYFTLISFTTIGFGDELPSEYDYMLLVGFMLLIGLSLVSTVMNLIQQQIEALGEGMQKNIDKEYMAALAEAEAEGEITKEDLKELGKKDEITVEDGREPLMAEENNGSLDAVVARMPIKARMLYHVMPNSAKKNLEARSKDRANRRNKGTQTDMFLLDALIKEEILKLELNNELDKMHPLKPQESPFPSRRERPRLISSDVLIDINAPPSGPISTVTAEDTTETPINIKVIKEAEV